MSRSGDVLVKYSIRQVYWGLKHAIGPDSVLNRRLGMPNLALPWARSDEVLDGARGLTGHYFRNRHLTDAREGVVLQAS